MLMSDSTVKDYPVAAYSALQQAAAYPLLMFTLHRRKRVAVWLITISLAILFIGSVLFAKRSMVLLFVVCLLLTFGWMRSTGRGLFGVFSAKGLLPYLIALLVAGFLVTRFLGGTEILGTGAEHLEQRFSALGTTDRMSHSVTGMERIIEAGFVLEDFEGVDNLVGRGLGGSYEVPYWWTIAMDQQNTGLAFRGRKGAHIGLFYLYIKGGIILVLLCFGGWFLAVVRKHPFWLEEYSRPYRAMGMLTLMGVVTGTAYSLGFNSIPSNFVIGLCIGYCGRVFNPEQDLHVVERAELRGF